MFSSTYRAFSRIDQHKTSVNKFKYTEIISSIFISHDNMKPETNYEKKLKRHKHVETKQHATEQPMGQ